MVLDVSKYHVIYYSSAYSLAVSHYSLSDSAISPVQIIRDLAVYSDSRLTFPLYFANVWNISLRALGFAMRHSSDFLLPLTIRLLYCSLLRLHVEYVYLIWSCYFVKRMLLPERIQHRFLRFASKRLPCALWAERTIIIPLPIMSLLDPRSVDEHRFVAGLSLLRKIIDDHANSWHILVSINSNAPLRPLRKPLLFLCHSYKLLIYILIL